MANQTSDRARMRDDLRELARQASGPRVSVEAPASSAQAFESADSSGYVDLSSFSPSDDGWVDRELARAKGGAVLSPGSMRPVSMEALLEVDPQSEEPASRKRAWIYSGLGLVGAGLVGLLAFTMSRHAPAPAKAAADTPVAAAAPAATTAAPSPAPDTGAAPSPSPAATVAAPMASVVVAAPDPGTSSKKHAGAHHFAPPSAPAHVAVAKPVAAAPRPAVIPAAKSGGSGDALMDAIKASVSKK